MDTPPPSSVSSRSCSSEQGLHLEARRVASRPASQRVLCRRVGTVGLVLLELAA